MKKGNIIRQTETKNTDGGHSEMQSGHGGAHPQLAGDARGGLPGRDACCQPLDSSSTIGNRHSALKHRMGGGQQNPYRDTLWITTGPAGA